MKRRVFIETGAVAGAAGAAAFGAEGPPGKERVKEVTYSPIVYFDTPGPSNTDDVIEIVRERLRKGDIRTVLVASTSGKTARKLKNALVKEKVKMVCVTEHAGFKSGDENLFDEGVRTELNAVGIPVVQASHVLSGVGRSISQKFGGTTPVEVIAHTLRLLGQGIKVAVEISIMAADAGVIATTDDVIAVAGTGSGSDSAIVIRPCHMNTFFNLAIREILAKPHL